MHKFSRDLLMQIWLDLRSSQTVAVNPNAGLRDKRPPTPGSVGLKAAEPPRVHSQRFIPHQGSRSLRSRPHGYNFSSENGRSPANRRPTCRTPSGARVPSQRISGLQVHPRRGQCSRYQLKAQSGVSRSQAVSLWDGAQRRDLTSESLWGSNILTPRRRRDQISLGAGGWDCKGELHGSRGLVRLVKGAFLWLKVKVSQATLKEGD